jgi:hypothetical protein
MLRIGIGMMNAVKNAINPWAHIRGTLGNVAIEKKQALPELVHGKSFMGSVTMMEK